MQTNDFDICPHFEGSMHGPRRQPQLLTDRVPTQEMPQIGRGLCEAIGQTILLNMILQHFENGQAPFARTVVPSGSSSALTINSRLNEFKNL